MPRRPRRSTPAPFFHVINRTARRVPIFIRPTEYRAFLRVLGEGLDKYPVRLLAYCVMSNHWHLVLGPDGTEALSSFMRWVTATHAVRWHHRHGSVGQGALYKGRYQAIAIDTGDSLVRVCRYVERNALAAGLVKRAEDWPWGSLFERIRAQPRLALSSAPFLLSSAWVTHVNLPATPADLVIDQEVGRARWADKNPTSVPKMPKTVEKSPVPYTTDPSTQAGSPEERREERTKSASEGAQTRTRPMPMLNARNISASAMPPRAAASWKSGGTVHARESSAAVRPSGSMRGRFSVMPPPVMCAMPLITAALEQRLDQRAGTTDAARSSASPTVVPELAARSCPTVESERLERDAPRERVAVGVQPRRRQADQHVARRDRSARRRSLALRHERRR